MDERHQELAKRMGMEHSQRMAALFDMIADDYETDILVALPSTAPALAEKLSRNEQELNKTLHGLFMRGLVIPSMKTDPPTYRLTHNVITFHDATALWSGATTEYRDLWREFMDEEWPVLSKTLTQAFRPATRIIPVGIAVEAQSRVLAFEDVKEIIDNARVVTVTDCPCRLTERKCDKPLEVCLHFDELGRYIVKQTLCVSGKDYRFGGAGPLATYLQWQGEPVRDGSYALVTDINVGDSHGFVYGEVHRYAPGSGV